MDDLISLCKQHLKKTRPTQAPNVRVQQLLNEMELQGCSGQDAIDTLTHYRMQTGLTQEVKDLCFEAIEVLKS